MGKPKADVTDAELAILKDLWASGASTIRGLAERLYPGGSTSEYATVQKLLERLESKGYVDRRSRGRANEFRARVGRAELIVQRLRQTANKLCEGSMAPLLTQLVDADALSPEELETLRRLVADRDAVDGGS